MLLIYVFSAQSTLPHVPEALLDLLLKKGMHMAAYAILYVLWYRALSLWLGGPWLLGSAWLLVVLYAASDELHQYGVPGRNGTVVDVLVDTVGASLAVLGVWAYSRILRRRSATG